MGGGLYIYYHLGRDTLSSWKGGTLLFLAFFFTGWSVMARYTNLPIALALGLHWVATRFLDWRKGKEGGITKGILPALLGAGIPLLAILLYDYYVFGSPLKTGYAITPYPVKFAFQYLGQFDANGVSIPGQILRYDLQGALRNLWIGFPLLIIGLPAFIVLFYRKLAVSLKWGNSAEKWPDLRAEMPWDILIILIVWFIAVFFLYLTYEWTAGLEEGGGFVIFDRFCLPGLFPVAIVGALIMARFPHKVFIPVISILVVFGAMLYAQWALDLHILPDWLTERTLQSRWPGYIFPPWTEAGTQFYPWPPR
jgi:hypothetical protein